MSKTLLLADDSVVIQKLVGLSFANEDVEIIATDNGDDAIARAREVNPDVVLADVVMPGKSGYEVCEAIKQDPDLAHVPVLLLTGTFEAFDEGRAEAAGANGQITKPFEAQSLVERVNTVLAEAAAAPAIVEPVETSASAQPAVATESASGDGVGYGRRATDAGAGLDASESDFFEDQVTPQLGADEIGSGLSADLTDEDELLSSPGLEISQDLAADFSDSPLAAYAGPSGAASNVAEEIPEDAPGHVFDDQGDTIISLPPATPVRASDASADSRSNAIGDRPDHDGLDGLGVGEALPLPDAMTAPPPVDLDPELDSNAESQRRIADATIIVGEDDVNASTFPSYAGAMSMDAEPEQDSSDQPAAAVLAEADSNTHPSDAFTVHAPSARIDQDAAVAPSPTVPSFEQSTQTSGVADLDASLNQGTLEAIHIGPSGSSDAFSAAADRGGESLPGEPDPLHVGPTSLGGEDLDFAFDVSEQREVSEAEALGEHAELAMDDVSDSQLIGSESSGWVGPTASSDESLVGDYDVSSSDLATAVPGFAEDQDIVSASKDDRAPESDTSFSAPLITPFSSSSSHSGTPTSPSGTPFSDDSAVGFDSAASPEFAPEPIQTGADDDSIALGSLTGEDRRVSDLSPLMEQRIQETLEKVAWEAFSDLSETIVKQVINRVEQVAWDVIPEMAETLVREEIRRMKGEED